MKIVHKKPFYYGFILTIFILGLILLSFELDKSDVLSINIKIIIFFILLMPGISLMLHGLYSDPSFCKLGLKLC